MLISFLNKGILTEIITGGANGVDSCAAQFAKQYGIPTRVIKADWALHGTKAGPIRNKQMANIADAVILFPGGAGTRSMHSIAKAARLKIYDFR